jgi:hypothetical protein
MAARNSGFAPRAASTSAQAGRSTVSVELLSLLGAGDRHADLQGPDVDRGWCGDCSVEGHARQVVAWHRPTASWLVADRIPLEELDGVRFGEVFGAFVDRLLVIEPFAVTR